MSELFIQILLASFIGSCAAIALMIFPVAWIAYRKTKSMKEQVTENPLESMMDGFTDSVEVDNSQ